MTNCQFLNFRTVLYLDAISVPDCESLIRKMLVLDPAKRYSISQIKRHRWMLLEVPVIMPTATSSSNSQHNEQVLRIMQSLGIDGAKTREVRTLTSMEYGASVLLPSHRQDRFPVSYHNSHSRVHSTQTLAHRPCACTRVSVEAETGV